MRWLLILVVFAFATGGATGVAAGFARWHKPPLDQRALVIARKSDLIRLRAQDMPPGGVVVFGDSISERQRLDRLCGLPAFNAGVGSARVSEVLTLADDVLVAAKPDRVVVEVGPNDFDVTPRTPLPVFMADFEKLLTKAGDRPIVTGMTLPAGRDAPEVVEANRAMEAAVKRRGGSYVEGVPVSMTEDGLHLTAAGRKEWRRRVNAAC